MRFSKVEARALLSFAKGNRDCDVDACNSSWGENIKTIYGVDSPKVVKKTWRSIIKKLRSVK